MQRTVEWLNRYLKGSAEPTGPTLEWVDQRGRHLGTETYPAPVTAPLLAALDGGRVLPLVPFVGGSGPMFLVPPVGGTKAFNAVNLTTPVAATTTYIAGEPTLTLSYSGTGTGDHVYAQLLDDTTGLVIGNQVTPIPVTLDGRPHTISVPLEMIAHTLNPGETLTVQLLAWSAAHAASWSLGTLTVNDMRITLPTTPDPIDIPHPLGVG
ncbi:MAG: hypothetical protein FGM52_05850 [Mycobacterium sp.]|nr:hypothetical protein [Mycobacterium sp.]